MMLYLNYYFEILWIKMSYIAGIEVAAPCVNAVVIKATALGGSSAMRERLNLPSALGCANRSMCETGAAHAYLGLPAPHITDRGDAASFMEGYAHVQAFLESDTVRTATAALVAAVLTPLYSAADLSAET